MKSRLTLIFVTLIVLLFTMLWVVQDRLASPAQPATSAIPLAAASAAPAAPMIVPPAIAAPAAPVAVQTVEPSTRPAPVATIAAPEKSVPMVHVTTSGDVKYIARAGDTLSQLAIALLGKDSKENRDAVVAANPSLQANPDRVLDGTTYTMPAGGVQDASDADVEPAADEKDANGTPAPADNTTPDTAAANSDAPKLKYNAQPGDTVSSLAANLLGANTKENRDSIIAENASLRIDPDHVIAGKTYTITAPNGLAADPKSLYPQTPSTQPDADEIARLSIGRELRYVAQPGDTVSKLAIVLLGSDTPANRDLIIKANRSLVNDPDHLVAGQTYWISAPTVETKP